MSGTGAVLTLSPRDYDAVLFDLDGVLTRTASVHAAAWKKLFDAFLGRRAADIGKPFVPFDIDSDYRRYVDGKPRQKLAFARLSGWPVWVDDDSHFDLDYHLRHTALPAPGSEEDPAGLPRASGRKIRRTFGTCAGDP